MADSSQLLDYYSQELAHSKNNDENVAQESKRPNYFSEKPPHSTQKLQFYLQSRTERYRRKLPT